MKMTKGIVRCGWMLSVLVLMLVLTGCALLVGAGAGAAGMAYVGSALEATVTADPPTVEQAVNAAFDSLQIGKISSRSTPLDAQIVGTMATRTDVVVNAKIWKEGGSRISIRVGAFGDKAVSRRIYDEILKHLPPTSGTESSTNAAGAVKS